MVSYLFLVRLWYGRSSCSQRPPGGAGALLNDDNEKLLFIEECSKPGNENTTMITYNLAVFLVIYLSSFFARVSACGLNKIIFLYSGIIPFLKGYQGLSCPYW